MFQAIVLKPTPEMNVNELLQSAQGERLGCKDEHMNRHELRSIEVIQQCAGFPKVLVPGAVFEAWSYGGHVWVDLTALYSAIGMEGAYAKGHKAFHKHCATLKAAVRRFDLSHSSIRQSVPYNGSSVAGEPWRCLAFTSVSVGALIVLSMRAGSASSQRHGLVEHEGNKAAFQRIFKGLLSQLPEDMRSLKQVSLPQCRMQTRREPQSFEARDHSCRVLKFCRPV